MTKRAAALCLALALLVLALAGCRASSPDSTETAATQSSTTAPAVDTRLADFSQRLTVLGAVSQEDFCANYQEALDLYRDGVRPSSPMPSYVPEQGETAPGDFYVAIVNPDTYGVSRFYVLPAGERGLTAEEYLELVEASESMAVQDLVLPENSWFSTQSGREDPLSSRTPYKSESFWLPYLLGISYQGQDLSAETETASALYLPLPVENAVYTLFPTCHMTPRGLLDYGLHSLAQAPESRRAQYTPPVDTDYEALRSAAEAAVLEHTDVTEDPAAVYFSFTDTTSPSADTRSYSWIVGLLYSDGASYAVRLDGPDMTLATIEKLPDGALDLNGNWSDLDAPQLTHDYIYP